MTRGVGVWRVKVLRIMPITKAPLTVDRSNCPTHFTANSPTVLLSILSTVQLMYDASIVRLRCYFLQCLLPSLNGAAFALSPSFWFFIPFVRSVFFTPTHTPTTHHDIARRHSQVCMTSCLTYTLTHVTCSQVFPFPSYPMLECLCVQGRTTPGLLRT